MTVKRINENIAYAKSVLVKNGISPDSPEYQDFLKIREICGNDHGYVGILTKIRFVDEITDMDEIKSIYDVLKKSKFDFAKLNKLTYDQILDMFYDELSGEKEKDSDLELYYKDSTYSYYKIHTYKGILKIGSPTWCLKTKSMWDKYQGLYGEQWVVVDNRYKKKLITPDDNYLHEYKSTKGYIRYGISLKHTDEHTISWQAFDDSNRNCDMSPNSYTFFGVMSTILNLTNGIKKSYYDYYPWCEKYKDTKTWHKIIDQESMCGCLRLGSDFFKGGSRDNSEVYIAFSESYSQCPICLVLNESIPFGFFLTNSKQVDKFAELTPKSKASTMLEEYATKSDNELYMGVKLKLGKISLDEVKKLKKYVTTIDNWMVFDRNDNYYLIVNTNIDTYQLPLETLDKQHFEMGNPMYWYLEKNTGKSYKVKFEGMNDIINDIFEFEENKGNIKDDIDVFDDSEKQEVKPETKKVKGFWDFLKRHK